MNLTSATYINELSRMINVTKMEKLTAPVIFLIEDHEKEALSKRLNVISIESLKITVQAKWLQTKSINHEIIGSVQAHVTKACAMTENPVGITIDESFTCRIVHPDQEQYLEEELDAFDDIEFSDTGDIDIGEIAVQYLIMAIPDIVRSEDCFVDDSLAEVCDVPNKVNPFDILKNLKNPQ